MTRLNLLLFAAAFFAAVFSSTEARGEYRVFQLAISDTQTGKTRMLLSTLDDIQYPGYYHVRQSEIVTIQDSWMCWRRSDHSQDPTQKYCPNPRDPASVGPPAPPGQ